MTRFRLSALARDDLAHILATSLDRWDEPGRQRYAALLTAAMKAIARVPDAVTTRDRSELAPGLRSMHIRHARGARGVKAPVHVIFYRCAPGVIEVVRVLHERMEPTAHLRTRQPRRR